ncbi:MAG: sulfotransferase [bacterium]|nr:sulfotransferase [bacterium]
MKNRPNFFIAGMPRSGTTSLYTYLKQHPDVFLSVYKEPHFFGKDLAQNIYAVRDEGIYNGLFAGAAGKAAIGEGSVWYLTSKTAAAEIKAFNPAAKIIIMLRNPVSMIYSLHSLYVRTGNENEVNFGKALALQPERMKGRAIPAGCYFPEGLLYTEVGKYYQKIKRFADEFGMANLHFVIFDDFAGDTALSYRGVLEFLGVDPGFPAEFDLAKASAVIREIVFKEIRHAHPEVRKKLANKTGLRAHKSPARAPLSPGLRVHLQEAFKEDVEKTGRLIGGDLLNKWGY